MRPVFLNAYLEPQHLHNKRQILSTMPISQQECFVQILGNLQLLHNQQQVGNVMKQLEQYKGSYSWLVLTLKYLQYSMEKQLNDNYNEFIVLKLLTKWIDIHENLKKRKQIEIYPAVVESLERGSVSYEQFIGYVNYISLDVLALLKSGSEESRKQNTDDSHTGHLKSSDLTQTIKAILPQVLFNLTVPRNFFPQTLLKSQDQLIDILYSNQNIQGLIHTKQHLTLLARTIIKILLSMELQTNQTKTLIMSAFNYYYLFHHDKAHGASQIVIESFKKMSSAVRYALHDQILIFFVILKKMGKELFINYLNDKFSWISEINKPTTSISQDNRSLKPFMNSLLQSSQYIKIEPRKIEQKYLQIYDRFSLIHFSLNCLEYDITIRFYYLGDFDKVEGEEEKKLLFGSDKKQGIFSGSVQAVQKGIYMFEMDNSYSWVKSKTVSYDISILVPIQIRQHSKNPYKEIIFEKLESMNHLPYECIVGWVDEKEIKISASSGSIHCIETTKERIYNLKVTKNSGNVYEYETESKSRLMKKIEKLCDETQIYWMIEDFRVQGVQQIRLWLDGQFKPFHHTMSNQGPKEEKEEAQNDSKGCKYHNISSDEGEEQQQRMEIREIQQVKEQGHKIKQKQQNEEENKNEKINEERDVQVQEEPTTEKISSNSRQYEQEEISD